LRLHRPAPMWNIVGPPSQDKTVDGFLATRLSHKDLDTIFNNLVKLREELVGNSPRQTKGHDD
jgi:hypothetical protein